MNPTLFKFLKYLFVFFGLVHLVATGLGYTIYRNTFPLDVDNPQTTPLYWWLDLTMTIIIIGLGISLALLLKQPSYHIFLAAALVLFGAQETWSQAWKGTFLERDASLSLVAALTACVWIYSMLRFAGKHTAQDYQNYFSQYKRPRWYKNTIIFFTKDTHFWFYFFPFVLALYFSYLFSQVLPYVANILVIATGLIYFRTSYHFAGRENRNRLSWMLWGILTTLVLYVVNLLLQQLFPSFLFLRIASYLVTDAVISISFTMSIFAGGTDANVVIRKTVVYSVLLLLGLFLFGVLEHLVIDTVSEMLHVQSSILNSCLGATIVLLISPLRHKVEHRLNRWEQASKRKAEERRRETAVSSAENTTAH